MKVSKGELKCYNKGCIDTRCFGLAWCLFRGWRFITSVFRAKEGKIPFLNIPESFLDVIVVLMCRVCVWNCGILYRIFNISA